MIRAELFLEFVSRSIGLELQLMRLNAQINVGLRLMLKYETKQKAVFIGFGPLAIVAWVDPKPPVEYVRP